MLDKHSSVPLYAQLKEILLQRIEEGVYGPGSQIPSELALCAELELSRPTVRQSIAELVSEGVLVIVKGKGTYVAEQNDPAVINNFNVYKYSFLLAKNLKDLEVDRITLVKQSEEILRLFKNDSIDQNGYWQIESPIKVENTLVGRSRSLIPVGMFPELADDIKNEKPMLDILANKYAYLPQRGSLKLQVRSAENHEAKYLDISRRSPIIACTGILTSRSSHISEVISLIIRPDLAVIDLEQERL